MSFFLMCNGDVYRPSYTIGGWLFLKYSALEEKKILFKAPCYVQERNYLYIAEYRGTLTLKS